MNIRAYRITWVMRYRTLHGMKFRAECLQPKAEFHTKKTEGFLGGNALVEMFATDASLGVWNSPQRRDLRLGNKNMSDGVCYLAWCGTNGTGQHEHTPGKMFLSTPAGKYIGRVLATYHTLFGSRPDLDHAVTARPSRVNSFSVCAKGARAQRYVRRKTNNSQACVCIYLQYWGSLCRTYLVTWYDTQHYV